MKKIRIVPYRLPKYFIETETFILMDKIEYEREKKKFGKHIVKLREKIESIDYPERSISQQELSDKSDNITKKTLGNIERGETNPKFETLLALAKVLGVTLKELFDFDNE